jgi:hypothetical protein
MPVLQHWCTFTSELVKRHKNAAKLSCCFNVSLECQRAVAWRRTQHAFYHRLLALLEEEKSALQQRCPAMEIPLPSLEAVPEALPIGDDICSSCTLCLRVRWSDCLLLLAASLHQVKVINIINVRWSEQLCPCHCDHTLAQRPTVCVSPRLPHACPCPFPPLLSFPAAAAVGATAALWAGWECPRLQMAAAHWLTIC